MATDPCPAVDKALQAVIPLRQLGWDGRWRPRCFTGRLPRPALVASSELMTITITCEDCGQRHRLERKVSEPGTIYIVCHGCELPLQAMLEPVAAAAPSETPAADLQVWSSIVDFGRSTASA